MRALANNDFIIRCHIIKYELMFVWVLMFHALRYRIIQCNKILMHFLIFKNASHFYYIRILSPIFMHFKKGQSSDFLKVGESQMKNIFLELFEQKSPPIRLLASNLHHWSHSNTYLNNDVTIFKGGGGHNLKTHGVDSPKIRSQVKRNISGITKQILFLNYQNFYFIRICLLIHFIL